MDNRKTPCIHKPAGRIRAHQVLLRERGIFQEITTVEHNHCCCAGCITQLYAISGKQSFPPIWSLKSKNQPAFCWVAGLAQCWVNRFVQQHKLADGDDHQKALFRARSGVSGDVKLESMGANVPVNSGLFGPTRADQSTLQTAWRWTPSYANPSPNPNSLLTGKNAGNFTRFCGSNCAPLSRNPYPERLSGHLPRLRARCGTGNSFGHIREFIGKNRESFLHPVWGKIHRNY